VVLDKPWALAQGIVRFLLSRGSINRPNTGFPDIKYEERHFTFSCSPLQEYNQITVKKIGKITTTMHEMLKAGDRIRIKGPYGEGLNFDESIKEDLALIAGGLE
jgi:NAD(P)H-flavin reductase